MNDFQRHERNRAFGRTIDRLRAAHSLVRAAQHENAAFDLNITALSEIERDLMHAIHCCAHVYKQPPETPS
jgi:hypothetical protein